ncbi:MAG: hypothetical protein ACLFV7_13350 [Phycisphaerae bacterium]
MRAWGFIAALCGLLLACGCEKPAEQPTTQPSTPYDAAYTAALAAADGFCEAWRSGRVDTTRGMLHPRLIKKHPEGHIRSVLAGDGNPRHAAYELCDGRRLAGGRYSFHVRLFYAYTGQTADRLEAPAGEIVLVEDDTGA